MAAVIHHGGAGTTAAGLRASCPSVIIPQSNDQPMWTRRVAELGVGAYLRPKKRLSVDVFVRVISDVLTPEVREKSETLGQLIREEDGVDRAVTCINRYLRDNHAGEPFNQPLTELTGAKKAH